MRLCIKKVLPKNICNIKWQIDEDLDHSLKNVDYEICFLIAPYRNPQWILHLRAVLAGTGQRSDITWTRHELEKLEPV